MIILILTFNIFFQEMEKGYVKEDQHLYCSEVHL